MRTLPAKQLHAAQFLWSLIFALALAFCTTGCLIIPTPHKDSGYARINVNKHTPEQFVPGKTARSDVIVALGEPDAVSTDERQLAYRSEKVYGLWIIAAAGEGGGGGTGGTIYRNHFWVFEFDAQGLFQKASRTGRWGVVVGDEEPVLSHPMPHSGNSNGVPASLVSDQVWRAFPKSYWLVAVDGYQTKGAKYVVGERGQLVLTESDLIFISESQFANAEPAMTLPLALIADVHLDKYFRARRLVVRTKTGQNHSFQITGARGIMQDKLAMQAACDFIQSKTKPTSLLNDRQ